MRIKLLFVGFIVLLSAISTLGQTASAIEMKYGKTENVYSVSEHIWMTPVYGADGQACMMRLYPRRISVDANYWFKTLPSGELKNVLNQLVPINTRGAKKYEYFPTTTTGGGIAWTSYPFEKVTFTFLNSFTITSAVKRSDDFVFDEELLSSEKTPETGLKSSDEVPHPLSPEPEIVEIRWKDRKCVGK